MTGGRGPETAFAGPVDWPPLEGDARLSTRQDDWRARLAEAIYGPFPAVPVELEVERMPLAGEAAERIVLSLTGPNGDAASRPFAVDAALWVPEGDGPFPLVTGLTFTGPAGLLSGDVFPLDPKARVHSQPEYQAEGRLTEALRGSEAHRMPVAELTGLGYAVMVSCYGSWSPDDPQAFESMGLRPFLGVETGAISLWAWAISRMIDAAARLGGLDTSHTIVAGHSRLGKAALWAAAHDRRIGAVLANSSGAGGSAPARHPVGETLAQMAEVFPHWLHPQSALPPVDQHQLLAAIAPRKVYLALAEDDLWADPVGSVMALAEASRLWPSAMEWPRPEAIWGSFRERHHPHLGYHIRPGGHDLLPHDWRRFLAFLAQSAT